MNLTTRKICERYARLCNLEHESLDAFVELLHPEVKWITKWKNFHGKVEIEYCLRESRERKQQSKGLSSIALVSGHPRDDGGYADCVVSVPLHEPDKHDTRTYFKTEDQFITSIFTYAEWIDRTWPYPERVKDKLAELICQDIRIRPIQPNPQPPKLVWPDDGRNPVDTKALERQAYLKAIRERIAQAFDADPKGTRIPDLGLE